MRLTTEYILLNWEQENTETHYYTFTEEGDAIICDIETEQFFYQSYRHEISISEACLLLRLIS